MADMTTTEAEQFLHNFHREGLVFETMVKEYDTTESVQKYVKSCEKVVYIGPGYCADMVRGLLPNKDALILDLGAGTGLVGQEVYNHGFHNLHAHDGAEAMLDHCRTLNIYKKFICCLVGDGHPLAVEDNTYDLLVCSGGTCPNHFPASAQSEFARVLKPGGYFVNCWRTSLLEIDLGKNWVAEAERLEKEGKWTLYGKLNFRSYNYYSDGVVDIYKAL